MKWSKAQCNNSNAVLSNKSMSFSAKIFCFALLAWQNTTFCCSLLLLCFLHLSRYAMTWICGIYVHTTMVYLFTKKRRMIVCTQVCRKSRSTSHTSTWVKFNSQDTPGWHAHLIMAYRVMFWKFLLKTGLETLKRHLFNLEVSVYSNWLPSTGSSHQGSQHFEVPVGGWRSELMVLL